MKGNIKNRFASRFVRSCLQAASELRLTLPFRTKNFGTAAASNGTAGLNSLNSDMLAAAALSASTGSPLSDAYEQNSKTETVYVFCFRLR